MEAAVNALLSNLAWDIASKHARLRVETREGKRVLVCWMEFMGAGKDRDKEIIAIINQTEP